MQYILSFNFHSNQNFGIKYYANTFINVYTHSLMKCRVNKYGIHLIISFMVPLWLINIYEGKSKVFMQFKFLYIKSYVAT